MVYYNHENEESTQGSQLVGSPCVESQGWIYARQEESYQQEDMQEEGASMSRPDYIPFFESGDLVEIDFGYGDKSIGLFMHYEKWADDLRAKVFWDGQDMSTPVVQLTLIKRATE